MANAPLPTHLSLWLVQLRTRSSLDAAHGVSTAAHRMLTIVGVHFDDDLGTIAGWGECSALNEPGYTPEWAAGAFELLSHGQPFDRAHAPMAHAAVEMALLDADLKAAGETLAERLGTSGLSAPAGAAVGMAPLPVMLTEIDELAAAGYQRMKIKIAPGKIVGPIEAIRSAFPTIDLHVDANASLSGEDITALKELEQLGVSVIEQPFAVNDRKSPARLVSDTQLTVAADEAVAGPPDVDQLARDRAANAIVVKPSKLGGLERARAVLDRVKATGMHASVGGMLESGLGRHLLAALAPLEHFSLVGDLSPASRWLIDDPFADISMDNGEIAAPTRPGIAGEPQLADLNNLQVRHTTVPATYLPHFRFNVR